jgi:hypothetical protein
MKRTLSLLLAIAATSGYAQTKAPAPGVCERFAQRLDVLDKSEADVLSQSYADTSAPRETARQLQRVNINLDRSMTLQQMIGLGCTPPTRSRSTAPANIGTPPCCAYRISW